MDGRVDCGSLGRLLCRLSFLKKPRNSPISMLRLRALGAIAVMAAAVTACSNQPSSLARSSGGGQVIAVAGVDGRNETMTEPVRGEAIASVTSAGAPVTVKLRVTPLNGAVAFELTANNTGAKRHELRFVDGREVDFVVRDSRGRDVWTWSDGKLFTQPMRTHLLEDHESRDYEARWQDALPHGTFTAIARFRSENHPATTQVVFTLP
jgi:hypothetical protein